MDLASACSTGDLKIVQSLIRNGANVRQKSRDGFAPLCNAAFWGYSEIVEYLLKHGADVNQCNGGTLWTACHCAAFQCHGKVIMKLMEHKPDVTLKDSQGRTAADFASALDMIWPFFAAEGCKRTPKSELIRLGIVRKVQEPSPTYAKSDYAHFSRPGSAYVMKPQQLHSSKASQQESQKAYAAKMGDVLCLEEDSEMDSVNSTPAFSLWRT